MTLPWNIDHYILPSIFDTQVILGVKVTVTQLHFNIFAYNFSVLRQAAMKLARNIHHNLLTCIWGQGRVRVQGHCLGQTCIYINAYSFNILALNSAGSIYDNMFTTFEVEVIEGVKFNLYFNIQIYDYNLPVLPCTAIKLAGSIHNNMWTRACI